MKRRARQLGLTLAEMLIALGLGLLVLLLGSVLLLSAASSYQALADGARLDDGGRYALEIIARAVRQTDFVDWDGAGAADDASPNIRGLDARTLDRASDGIAMARPAGDNSSDVLALRYPGAGPAPGGDGSVLNCAGFPVAAGATPDQRGWSIFYVARAADGIAELRCKYQGKSSWGADAIVRGVDSFQVLYGIDTDMPRDGLANRYLSASALDALDAMLALDGTDAAARMRDLNRKSHWKRVTAIKVGLLLHGVQDSAEADVTRTFDLFGKAYGDAHARADPGSRVSSSHLRRSVRARERQVFQATFLLRKGPA